MPKTLENEKTDAEKMSAFADSIIEFLSNKPKLSTADGVEFLERAIRRTLSEVDVLRDFYPEKSEGDNA